MLPTSFSLRLYCGQPACTPSRISFALLLVLTFLALFPRAPLGRWLLTGSLRVILREPARAPHLVLTFLAIFPHAPLGRWLLTGSLRVILREPARAPPHAPLSSLRSSPGSLEHPRVTHVHVRLIYILFACANLCLLLASRHSPSTCHF